MPSSATPFAAQVVHHDGSVTLRLRGELDIATVPVLRQVVADLVKPHLRAVMFDLEGLDFVDLIGLRGISEAMGIVEANNAEFRVCAVSELARRVIRTAEINDLLRAIETSAETDADPTPGPTESR